jgi:hypothetical protein
MSKICLLTTALFLIIVIKVSSGPINCNLSKYNAQNGLNATVQNETLTVLWEGDKNSELRARFIISEGIPTIKELSIRLSGNKWQTVASNVTPEFRVVSGVRRVTQQQTEPLVEMGVELTTEKLNEIKWDAFWDAPLYIDDAPQVKRSSSIPANEAFANHPGMPRKQEEIKRSTATYNATTCKVVTNGARLEITFPGVQAGIFSGYLQFDVFKGSNLLRQMLVAKTEETSAAFKYDTGLKGFSAQSARLVWHDLANRWQQNKLGGSPSETPMIIHTNNRLIAADFENGAIAAFPPPHSFYWARESEENLGYSWFRKDDERTFSFGLRQAELENNPEFHQNFALYSARPGTWQHMPVFYYISANSGEDAIEKALAFTNGDKYKALPGYKIMGHHYHMGMLDRVWESGIETPYLNDIETMKGMGVNIFSIIDGVRGPARHDRGEAYLDELHEYYEAAKMYSDDDFLLMPSDENSTDGRPPFLGGHYDILPSKPIYWRPQRKEGQPVIETHPKYGTVYNLGTPEDMTTMTEHANVLLSLPHPNTKGSTGYPEAFKDKPHFLHENYKSLGYRWGMGIDASEKRLGEYRFLSLWDRTNNWMAQSGAAPKFALAISEARSDKGNRGRPPYDDAYGMSPVNYLKLDKVPGVDDMSPIIDVLKSGDYFMTSGEVLIPFYEVRGKGNQKTIVAEVEWTFPLEFVEVVWGDGTKTGRQIISTTDLLPFGKKRFEIPFDASGKKWVRFAAWDVATNGAMVQPVGLYD